MHSGIPMELLTITLAWLGYFSVHSLLASLTVKQWLADRWPAFTPAYRLGYNGLALLTLGPPLWLTSVYHGPPLWIWDGLGSYVSDTLFVFALVGFAWSIKYYDMSIFLGFRQWQTRLKDPIEPGPLCLSPLHRYVRHPWYSLGLLIVWTREMDLAWLAAAVLITTYFLVGSRLEERKLLTLYGEAYRRYRERVPAFVPWFGRNLSRTDVAELSRLAMRRAHLPSERQIQR